jgi:hypothetical protein
MTRATRLTPADGERLSTWQLDIVRTINPDAKVRAEGDERRVIGIGIGGLSISAAAGVWYCHSAGKGGGPVELIEFLRECSETDAVVWARAFLKSHPGTGELTLANHPEIDIAELARGLLDRLVDPADTPAIAYQKARGILIPPPACVRFLPDARTGEHAIVGLLSANGRTVGLQLGYIDPTGRKSLVLPQRRRFNIEKAPGAVFEIRPGTGPVTVVAEGLEDGLSAMQVMPHPATGILAIPGIPALRDLPAKAGDNLIILRDGDRPGSPAAEALTAGVDYLILAGARVWVVAMPDGRDANDILREDGPDALHDLIVNAAPAKLSRMGELHRLARLDNLDYETKRKEAAKFLDFRREVLDAEVKRIRAEEKAKAANGGAEDEPDAIELIEDGAPPLAEILDGIAAECRRYIVADEADFTRVTLWCAHAHLVHNAVVRPDRSPRLAIQAKTPGSGKSELLTFVGALVPKPRPSSSMTAATVWRVIEAVRPTLLVDEADNVLRDRNSDLLAILNAGDKRSTGFIERCIEIPESKGGGWEVRRVPVFGAVAYAGIGDLPPTQQDRSIVVIMQRAIWSEIQDHLRDGNSPELELLKRQLATWAHDLQVGDLNLEPPMPAVLQRQAGRVGDNFRVLLAIAHAAGGDWPAKAEAAAMASLEIEQRETRIERLLRCIRLVFDEGMGVVDDNGPVIDPATGDVKKKPLDKIPTDQLVERLVSEHRAEGWDTVNRGKPINEYWLRYNLRHLLKPPKSKDWYDTDKGRRVHRRGYLRTQFENSWKRYLPGEFSPGAPPPEPSGSSGLSGEAVDIDDVYPVHDPVQNEIDPVQHAVRGGQAAGAPAGSDGSAEPDHPKKRTGSRTGSKSRKSKTSPDKPDEPDGFRGGPGEGKSAGDGDGAANGGEPDLIANMRAYAARYPELGAGAIASWFGQSVARTVAIIGRQ